MNGFSRNGTNVIANHASAKRNSSKPLAPLNPLNVAIARLSDLDVAQMTREDLIQLVNYSILCGIPVEGTPRLELIEVSQLKRLASQTRNAWRHSVNHAFIERGQKCAFID